MGIVRDLVSGNRRGDSLWELLTYHSLPSSTVSSKTVRTDLHVEGRNATRMVCVSSGRSSPTDGLKLNSDKEEA